jgi:hypothetical protein
MADELRVCKCCELTGRPEFGHSGMFCGVCVDDEPLELDYLSRISDVLDMLPAFAIQIEEMRAKLAEPEKVVWHRIEDKITDTKQRERDNETEQ